jgi:cyclopropane fatty-acyl-phospholipid synthase-like methyltransferase
MNDYQRCIVFWDSIFSEQDDTVPNGLSSGNAVLDDAIGWLAKDSKRILDFGCGNGALLFYAAQYGAKSHLGIDLSEQAVAIARKKATNMPCGTFEFRQGGVDALSEVADVTYDAVMLSNIVDNLYPEDALLLLHECARILKETGKVLVKLNPYLTQEQIVAWKIKTISDNLLDDGLLLWNQTTEQWHDFFRTCFVVSHECEIYYPEQEQTNRIFYLTKHGM